MVSIPSCFLNRIGWFPGLTEDVNIIELTSYDSHGDLTTVLSDYDYALFDSV